MTKSLVTGGAGFIGTNLVKRLLSNGHKVVSLDNYSTGKKENEVRHPNVKYLDIDLSKDINFDSIVNNVGTIFHLGALARIQPSLTDPINHIKNNFLSTLTILDYARDKELPVVYAGSSSFHHGLYESPYAWSKWSGEELCKLYSNVYNLKTSVCRFYNVYGPHQLDEGDYSTVVGIFQRQYNAKEPLTITGDGQQRRDFTHVEDIIDGLVKCAGGDFKSEVFELGTGINYSINELADLFGKNYPKKYLPSRKGEYDVTLADYSKAKEKLNWKPIKKLDDYIKNFLDEQNRKN